MTVEGREYSYKGTPEEKCNLLHVVDSDESAGAAFVARVERRLHPQVDWGISHCLCFCI